MAVPGFLRGVLLVVAAALLALPGALAAQEGTEETPIVPVPAEGEVVRSPVLTIDPDRLFSDSLFGQRIADEIQAETEALAAENRAITARLEEEEQSLTERRPTMEPEAFRAEADAFDARVREIRREQDAKERAIGTRVQQAQEEFLRAVRPVLGQLMIERGAAVVLDRRTVVLGVGAVDITEAAIDRIDVEMGEGPDIPTGPTDPAEATDEADETLPAPGTLPEVAPGEDSDALP